jgi:DNA-binding Xre family transcriptional regulator
VIQVLIITKLKMAMTVYSQTAGKKLTYKALAEGSGLSLSTIESLASRPSYMPSLDVIDKLCRFLGCTVQDLLEYREG